VDAWIRMLSDDPALGDAVETVTIGPSERTRERGKARQDGHDWNGAFPGLVKLWTKLPKLREVTIAGYSGALTALIRVAADAVELDTVASLSLVDCWPGGLNPYGKGLLGELVEVVPCLRQLSIDFGLCGADEPKVYHSKPLGFEQLHRVRFLNWDPAKTTHIARMTRMLPTVETLVLHESSQVAYPPVLPLLKCTWLTGLGWTGGANRVDRPQVLSQLDLTRFNNLTDFDFSNGRCRPQFQLRFPPSLQELIVGDGVDCPVSSLLELVQPGPRRLPNLEWIHHNQINAKQGTFFRPKTEEELGTDEEGFHEDTYSENNDAWFVDEGPRRVELATDWVLPKWTDHVPEAGFAQLVATAAQHGVGVIGTSVDALAVESAWCSLGGATAAAAEQDDGLFEEFLTPFDPADEADLATIARESAALDRDAAAHRECRIERDTLAWADARLIGALGKLFASRERFYEVEKALHWTPQEAENYDALPRYEVGHDLLWGWDLHKQVEQRKPFFAVGR